MQGGASLDSDVDCERDQRGNRQQQQEGDSAEDESSARSRLTAKFVHDAFGGGLVHSLPIPDKPINTGIKQCDTSPLGVTDDPRFTMSGSSWHDGWGRSDGAATGEYRQSFC